jgi:pimeloyl-ACP methyl ester carboxylesterase
LNKIPIETVHLNGFAMDYFRFGSGKDTMVILPGLSVQSVMGSADAVAEAYQPFAEDFSVYLFDRRKELPSAYSVEDMARDTTLAMMKLGLERVCIFGASQGGMISQVIAIEYPDLVRRLAVGSSAARVSEAMSRTLEGWIRLARNGDAEGLYLSFGEAVYPQELFEQSRQLLRDVAKTVTHDDLERFIILAECGEGFDISDDLKNITCPTLIIGSQDDQVTGGDASVEISERLNGHTDCELYMYDGFGHAAYDTAPDYKARLLKFFKG